MDGAGLNMDYYLSILPPLGDTALWATDSISLPLTIAPSRLAPSAHTLADAAVMLKNIEPKFRFEATLLSETQVAMAQ